MTRADHLALVTARIEAARARIAEEERAERIAEARARREERLSPSVRPGPAPAGEVRCARERCGRTFTYRPGKLFCERRCAHREHDQKYQARVRAGEQMNGGRNGRPRSRRGGKCLNCRRRVPETSRFALYCSNSCACIFGRKRRLEEQGPVGRMAFAVRMGGAA